MKTDAKIILTKTIKEGKNQKLERRLLQCCLRLCIGQPLPAAAMNFFAFHPVHPNLTAELAYLQNAADSRHLTQTSSEHQASCDDIYFVSSF